MAKFLSFFAFVMCCASAGICSDDEDLVNDGDHSISSHKRSLSTISQELSFREDVAEESIDAEESTKEDPLDKTASKRLKIYIPTERMNQIKIDVQKWARQQGETISLPSLTQKISEIVEMRMGIQLSQNQRETIAQAIIAQLIENGQLYKNKTEGPFFYTRIPLRKLPSSPNSGKKLAESPKKKEAALRPQINRTTSNNLGDYIDEALQKIQTSNSSSNGSNESNSDDDDHSEESDVQ